MRQIIAFNNVSADGYFADANGSLEWVMPDESISAAGAARMPENDTILFGRRTYQMFESFWPRALDESDTSPNPHSAGRSPTMRAMAVWINRATKIVFSRSLKKVTWKNSEILHELDPHHIEAMKNEAGKNMMIFGSGSIVSQLTSHGLIDEYQFVVNPILLGSGRNLIGDVQERSRLQLVEAKPYESGNVVLRYTRSS
jgi:dihydrofolate reductase